MPGDTAQSAGGAYERWENCLLLHQVEYIIIQDLTGVQLVTVRSKESFFVRIRPFGQF